MWVGKRICIVQITNNASAVALRGNNLDKRIFRSIKFFTAFSIYYRTNIRKMHYTLESSVLFFQQLIMNNE